MFTYDKKGSLMYAIKELREIVGMSQRAFSDYLSIPVTNIQQWEQGVVTPPDYVVSLITRVMKSDGLLDNTLNPHQVNLLRQTEKTLELENLHISPEYRNDLKHLVAGSLSLDDYMAHVKKRYINRKN